MPRDKSALGKNTIVVVDVYVQFVCDLFVSEVKTAATALLLRSCSYLEEDIQ